MLYTATIIIKTTTACPCSGRMAMPHPAEGRLARYALMTPDHNLATGPRFLPPDSRPLFGGSSAKELADSASGEPDSRPLLEGSSAGGGAHAVSSPVSCPLLEGGGASSNRVPTAGMPLSSPCLEGRAPGCNRLFCVMRDAAGAETGFLNKGFHAHTSLSR